MENNIEKLYNEMMFEYKRINGREFPNKTPLEGDVEKWRVDAMIEAIKVFKTLPSFNNKNK